MHKKERSHKKHKTWQLQDAKAKFSKLVDEVIEDGYHTITRNGQPVVIVISKKDFEKYLRSTETLIDFFQRAPFPDFDLNLTRDKDTGREIDL